MHRHGPPCLVAPSLALTIALASSCAEPASPDPDPGGGKLDDVSDGTLTALDTAFLIPAPGTGSPFLPIGAQGPHGAVLDFDDFSEIHDGSEYNAEDGAAAGLTGSESELYNKTFLTAFRYDPCAPQQFHGAPPAPTSAADCNHQFRMVFQTWTGDGFADAGLHVSVRLDADESAQMRERLRNMKQACGESTAGALVGPHPCLVGPGAEVFFEQEVAPLILDFSGKKSLLAVAVVVRAQAEWRWRFFANAPVLGFFRAKRLPNVGGNEFAGIRADGTFSPAVFSRLHEVDGTELPSQAVEAITVGGIENRPLSEIADGLAATYLTQNPRLSKIPKVNDFLLWLLNPLSNPKKVLPGLDCASCHAQDAPLAVAEEQGILDRIAAEDPALLARLEAAAFKPLDQLRDEHLPATRALELELAAAGDQVVLSLAFLGRTPVVNRRTQHEAEEVEKYLAEIVQE